jgi:hypothetical protein
MGATENRCANILILLALQAPVRLSRFWTDKGLDFYRPCILPVFQSDIELPHHVAGSILRASLADQYCAAVPNFTVQYPAPMLLISHMIVGRARTIRRWCLPKR